MFEEYRRVIAAQGASEQAHRILRIGRHGQAPADAMQPLYFVGLTVPGVAALEESARDAHHHRGRESIDRAPAHRAAVVELLSGGVGILAEWTLRHGQEAGRRHADRATDDALFGKTGVEPSVRPELLL